MNYVALKPLSYDDNLSLFKIKRDLLFFDKICIDPLLYDYFLKQLYYNKLFFDGKKGMAIFSYYQVNFKYLIDNQFIIFTPVDKVFKEIKKEKSPKIIKLISEYNKGLKKIQSNYKWLNDKIKNIDNEIIQTKKNIEDYVTSDGKLFVLGENEIPVKTGMRSEIKEKDDMKIGVNKFCEILHQLTFSYSEDLFDDNTISTSVRNHNDKRMFQFQNQSDNILNIILSKVPIPDAKISFEQIIDFRKDPDSTNKFLRLRNWIIELSKCELTQKELIEKIEFVISDYEQHLKYHKLKYNYSQLETFIGLPFEIAENLIKLKWKDAIKSIFTITKNKIDYAKDEANLKNNEVAYLNKIKETFDPTSDMEKWENMIKVKRIR